MIAVYEPAQRAELAALMERVWGERTPEAELAWWHEQPGTTTLVAAEDGRLVGAAAMSLARMLLGGEETPVGIATRLATDPAFQGRGIFGRLERASEERAEAAGARLLLVVPNAASKPIFLERLGWTELAPLRIWLRPLPGRARGEVARLDPLPPREGGLVRDADHLAWRFGGARRYRLFQTARGYTAVGRRGRLAVVAATAGAAPLGVAGPAIAAPPPGLERTFLAAGYLPTPRTLTVLGRSLGAPLPQRVGLELGDLDFL